MKNLILILLIILFISGCYTMINHPEVEVYYERDNGEEYLTEEYDVFVDEDCSTCHDEFIAQKHFSPLIPAHQDKSNWNDIPWWLDTKYLMFISGNNDSIYSGSGNSGYQHVGSQTRNDPPPAQQGGYITAPARGGTASTNSSAVTSTQAPEESGSGSKSAVRTQDSGSKSNSSTSTSKRKFRKRK